MKKSRDARLYWLCQVVLFVVVYFIKRLQRTVCVTEYFEKHKIFVIIKAENGEKIGLAK